MNYGKLLQRTFTGLILLTFMTVGVAAQQRVDETKAARADGQVKIFNLSGSIKVIGSDRNEITVKGTLGEGTERLDFTVSGNETVIEVVIMDEDERKRRDIRVRGSDLEITVPAGSRLDVDTVSADITVSGVTSDMDLESVSGNLDVGATPGRIWAHSISGDITIASSQAPLRANTVSGRITVREVTGRFDVGTISGDIKVNGLNIEEGNFESLSGDQEFQGTLTANGNLIMENHSGSIDLYLPANVSASFDVTTFSGDIKNQFGQEAVRTSRFVPGEVLQFETGGGSARVKISSFSGDVEINKK
jgi:DUF4097 and DUF4098 domain-containing protein YvlB